MKKFSLALVAMLLVAMLATVAFAAPTLSARYENGKVYYSASGFTANADILLDGEHIDTLTPSYTSGQATRDFAPGSTHTVALKSADGNTSASFTVPGAVETEEPSEAPTTEAPTTEAPTTEAPTTEAPTTEAPTTEAPTTSAPTTDAPTTVAPTKTAGADADDDVPKTGDSATLTFVVGGAMVLAAAYLLLRRRVHSK